MLERVGCYTKRWKRIKRSGFADEDFLKSDITAGQAPESSLSSASSTDSSNGSKKSKRSAKKTKKESISNYSEAPSELSSEKIVSFSESGEGGPKSHQKRRFQESATSQSVVSSSEDSANYKPTSSKRCRTSSFQHVLPAPSRTASLTTQSIASTAQPYPLQALSSYNLSLVNPKTRTSASYYMNEDDMILIEDVMMCPYVFRSSHAVECGALAEVVVPGMLRVQFSNNNKLLSMELVFDAMGFMQQLDGANGGNITAQVIPGSLEMALMHCNHEARVITKATSPYNILHVNEAWTKLTQHTQVEVEGKALLPLLEGSETPANLEGEMMVTTNAGKKSTLLDDAANGRTRVSTCVHYSKSGKPFVDFMCTYPLTK